VTVVPGARRAAAFPLPAALAPAVAALAVAEALASVDALAAADALATANALAVTAALAAAEAFAAAALATVALAAAPSRATTIAIVPTYPSVSRRRAWRCRGETVAAKSSLVHTRRSPQRFTTTSMALSW